VVVLKRSGNYSAFEHFIGDGGRHFVDEYGTHLSIIVKKI